MELYIIAAPSDARHGKESGDPTVPARGIATGRQGGYDRCAVCLAPDRWPRELPNYESRAPPGAHARQGKETVHLVGNRKTWWDDKAGTDVTGGPDCCRCPRVS